MKTEIKSKTNPSRPNHNLPWSPFALFHMALKGIDLYDLRTMKMVTKWEAFNTYQNQPEVLEMIKKHIHCRFNYIKRNNGNK